MAIKLLCKLINITSEYIRDGNELVEETRDTRVRFKTMLFKFV